MNQRQSVFAQLTEHLPRRQFRRIMGRYGGNDGVRSFRCWDQYLCMAFARLTFRESLPDIEATPGAVPEKLYHTGVRGNVRRSTLADANERRDWRIYTDFAQRLITTARRLYVDEPFGVDLEQTVYALDATTIDLCLSLFPSAQFRTTKAGIELHTLLDLAGVTAGNLPSHIPLLCLDHRGQDERRADPRRARPRGLGRGLPRAAPADALQGPGDGQAGRAAHQRPRAPCARRSRALPRAVAGRTLLQPDTTDGV